jgi:hypothetical protein
MPVVFADATDCSRLLYWGILTHIEVEDKTTRYSLKQVRGAQRSTLSAGAVAKKHR